MIFLKKTLNQKRMLLHCSQPARLCPVIRCNALRLLHPTISDTRNAGLILESRLPGPGQACKARGLLTLEKSVGCYRNTLIAKESFVDRRREWNQAACCPRSNHRSLQRLDSALALSLIISQMILGRTAPNCPVSPAGSRRMASGLYCDRRQPRTRLPWKK